MQIQRLSAPLGAIVKDVDVRDVNEETLQKLHDMFNEFKVLVFPDQNLKPEDHMNFAENWGKLIRHPYAGLASHPDIIELKNAGKRKDVNQHWHSDMTYNGLGADFPGSSPRADSSQRWPAAKRGQSPDSGFGRRGDIQQVSGNRGETGRVLSGRGFGHGIGLCQTGALARAAAGQSFTDILAHYYPGAQLVRLQADPTVIDYLKNHRHIGLLNFQVDDYNHAQEVEDKRI